MLWKKMVDICTKEIPHVEIYVQWSTKKKPINFDKNIRESNKTLSPSELVSMFFLQNFFPVELMSMFLLLSLYLWLTFGSKWITWTASCHGWLDGEKISYTICVLWSIKMVTKFQLEKKKEALCQLGNNIVNSNNIKK